MDCLFCKIIAKQIPSRTVYEDDLVYAFHDIEPQMPVHILIVPKIHIDSPAQINEENSAIVGHIFAVAAKIAESVGLSGGYRVITNCGKDAGQTVGHLHFHLLGGSTMSAKIV